jgi:hypothetical protein
MRRLRHLLLILLLTLGLAAGVATPARQTAARPESHPERLSAQEFSRLIRELSEEGGFFRSDNLISNETSYLHVVDKLKQMGVAGGAYLGVGPEQNFTYIAKIRPRLAFIVDIRRQAMIQHLMYKAIFHLAPHRAQFLALLLSRPLSKEKTLGENASVPELLEYFSRTPASDQAFTANLAEIQKTIEKEFQVPLSDADRAGLEYIYRNFRDDGLEITYRSNGNFSGFRRRGSGSSPSLGELIAQPDQFGKLGHFLAGAEDYQFVRELHRKNLIIPVTGDFGGSKALAAVGDYLRQYGFTVSAFYTSNVEQYLFGSDSFGGFVRNVRKLPITDRSVFIRSVFSRYSHPARMSGHSSATLLQQMPVFLKDYDDGRYPDYWGLISTNYIPIGRQ